MSSLTIRETQFSSNIHPKKFALWIAIASIVMMFAGFTSAYIVRRAAGEWIVYKLPEMFTLSTFLILISSFTLHAAYLALKKENIRGYKTGLGASLVLGVAFLIAQYLGWQDMMSYGIRLQGNPSGAFVYIISGVHGLHLVGGVVLLAIFFIKSLIKTDPVKRLISEMNPERYLGMELLLTYWHFVDILWLYLFLFLWYNSF